MITRPRRGDIWEFKLPNKPKRKKEVGRIFRPWKHKRDEQGRSIGQCRIVWIEWYRLPKGRYTGIRVKTLLKYGTRLSTKVERDTEREKRWQETLKRRIKKI